MRPDQLVVYVLFAEADRLSRTPQYRRYRPPFIAALSRIVGTLPNSQAVPKEALELSKLYKHALTMDDVVAACHDFNIEEHQNFIMEILTETHLHAAFDALLKWDHLGGVEAQCGETTSMLDPVDMPLKDGELHGVVQYGKERHVFHDGWEVPQPLTAKTADAYYDEFEHHLILVNLLGVENYLKTSARATTVSDKRFKLISTDRFAIIEVDGKKVRSPHSLSLEESKRWFDAWLKEA